MSDTMIMDHDGIDIDTTLHMHWYLYTEITTLKISKQDWRYKCRPVMKEKAESRE